MTRTVSDVTRVGVLAPRHARPFVDKKCGGEVCLESFIGMFAHWLCFPLQLFNSLFILPALLCYWRFKHDCHTG